MPGHIRTLNRWRNGHRYTNDEVVEQLIRYHSAADHANDELEKLCKMYASTGAVYGIGYMITEMNSNRRWTRNFVSWVRQGLRDYQRKLKALYPGGSDCVR